jgi:hypothetical protein
MSLLKTHHPDCERCNVPETWGYEMRKRLEELNGSPQPKWTEEEVQQEAA